MAGKVLLSVLLAFSLLLSSCYPELSVQQYDKLKKDLAELDVQRRALEEESAALKAKHIEIRAYVDFLNKLVSTQSSEKILAGQFDTNSLLNAKAELSGLADNLKDNQILYFLELMKPESSGQTVAAYYKIIEYSLKKMRQNLE